MSDLIRKSDALAAMKRAKAAYLKSTDNTPLDFFWRDAIAALPAVTVGVKPPFYFDRYINGVRMAEDVCVERETTIESAMLVAARIASKGPNGEAPVLVYRAPVAAPDPAAIREAWEKAYWRMRSYAVHDNDCKLNKPPRFDGPCSCGLTAALEEALALISKGATEPTEYERKVAQMKKDFPNGI